MLSQESAETFALGVLQWLAGQDDLLGVFLGASGLSEQGLRERAGDPEVLGAVLDFVMMDDQWVRQCCDHLEQPYESLMQARAALPGGEQVHWT
ncbi:DUF3572 family protein [Aliishimia ponticola]|uniref:DUF3572 family protein n=1 Tax=Aliishimia ponticola TaxID=2499833 RepID=A0A4S4N907_9RHOB|nr:DUF3572 domain-containing protein [Aliishimia ponticola]THH35724.1 DUF3572 family protein [Aliishimia ponticola]